MLSSWTIGKKLLLLAIFNSGILLGVSILFNYNQSNLINSLNDIGGTQLPVVKSMTLADMMHDGLRAVVMTSSVAAFTKDTKGLEEASKEYDEFSKNINDYLNEIKSSNISAETKSQVEEASKVVGAYVSAGKVIIDLNSQQNLKEALEKLPAFQEAFENLEEKLGTLGDNIEKTAEAHVKESSEVANRSSVIGKIIAGVGLLLALLMSIAISRSLISALTTVVEKLNAQRELLKSYTFSINDASSQLSSSSTQTAAAVQETASAIEEINSTVIKTADNSRMLAQNANTSHDIVSDGRNTVNNMMSEMENISSVSKGVMSQLEAGNQQIKNIVTVIGEIGQKTKVINDIVFQTKLLSFNASVEAARAGEHGKGFAVVAEEVGNLAQMSGNAAKEISQMLDQSIKQVSEIIDTNQSQVSSLMTQNLNKIEDGKRVAEQCGKIFAKIVEQVETVTSLSSESSVAIQEQKTGLEEVNKAINSFNEAAQSTSLSAQKSSELARNLQASFEELTSLMTGLEKLVYGNKSLSRQGHRESESHDQSFDKQAA